jgi:hypothetical protein
MDFPAGGSRTGISLTLWLKGLHTISGIVVAPSIYRINWGNVEL